MNRLLTAFYDTPWAIIPDRLPLIREVLHRWASGVKLSTDEIRAAVGDSPADEALPTVDSAAWTMLASELMNLDEILNK